MKLESILLSSFAAAKSIPCLSQEGFQGDEEVNSERLVGSMRPGTPFILDIESRVAAFSDPGLPYLELRSLTKNQAVQEARSFLDNKNIPLDQVVSLCHRYYWVGPKHIANHTCGSPACSVTLKYRNFEFTKKIRTTNKVEMILPGQIKRVRFGGRTRHSEFYTYLLKNETRAMWFNEVYSIFDIQYTKDDKVLNTFFNKTLTIQNAPAGYIGYILVK